MWHACNKDQRKNKNIFQGLSTRNNIIIDAINLIFQNKLLLCDPNKIQF